MKDILLVYQEEAIRNRLARYLEAGLSREVTIKAVDDARIGDLISHNFDAYLLEEKGMGAGVQLARDILSAAACKEGSDGQEKKPFIALVSESPIRVFDNLRPQELTQTDIQVIGLCDFALFGFYLGRIFWEGSDYSLIKFDHWLKEVGLDGLYYGPPPSGQIRELNDSLLRLLMSMGDNGFLFQPPRDYMLKHRVQLERGLPSGCQEMFKQMLGSVHHKER